MTLKQRIARPWPSVNAGKMIDGQRRSTAKLKNEWAYLHLIHGVRRIVCSRIFPQELGLAGWDISGLDLYHYAFSDLQSSC